jgi:hypothetical protein
LPGHDVLATIIAENADRPGILECRVKMSKGSPDEAA